MPLERQLVLGQCLYDDYVLAVTVVILPAGVTGKTTLSWHHGQQVCEVLTNTRLQLVQLYTMLSKATIQSRTRVPFGVHKHP